MSKRNPEFSGMLPQAIGGAEGEIRVCMQYFFQAWDDRATEGIGHSEMGEPLGEEPALGPARPDSGAQNKQIG